MGSEIVCKDIFEVVGWFESVEDFWLLIPRFESALTARAFILSRSVVLSITLLSCCVGGGLN